ncbi:hypothetical protein JCM19301_3174 [Jejuia pallidilutea]|uniref:Uncharacterized protein n=1 Tax=Jejuia pallidilutea TaxID=504487 RepID=A0A090VPQ4_9FLAO|nr:hypothetical protein JCM19301_3174 [Jejuia pallidilutea]GAL69956.1 hypothetical protein JCM19302_851 [Jejuia pallidilutea]GAL90964.1 hypothetical protein JCM19538_1022 [Jejuia pallidilutea]
MFVIAFGHGSKIIKDVKVLKYLGVTTRVGFYSCISILNY